MSIFETRESSEIAVVHFILSHFCPLNWSGMFSRHTQNELVCSKRQKWYDLFWNVFSFMCASNFCSKISDSKINRNQIMPHYAFEIRRMFVCWFCASSTVIVYHFNCKCLRENDVGSNWKRKVTDQFDCLFLFCDGNDKQFAEKHPLVVCILSDLDYGVTAYAKGKQTPFRSQSTHTHWLEEINVLFVSRSTKWFLSMLFDWLFFFADIVERGVSEILIDSNYYFIARVADESCEVSAICGKMWMIFVVSS